MKNNRHWSALCLAVVATAVFLIVQALRPSEAVAQALPILSSDRVADLLNGFSGGDAIAGPLLWSSDTAPANQLLYKDSTTSGFIGGFVLTIANLGKTSLTVTSGGTPIATVLPSESVAVGFDTLSTTVFSAADIGAGPGTRFVWVMRRT